MKFQHQWVLSFSLSSMIRFGNEYEYPIQKFNPDLIESTDGDIKTTDDLIPCGPPMMITQLITAVASVSSYCLIHP